MHPRVTYLLMLLLLTMALTFSASPSLAQSNEPGSFRIIESTAQELLVELTVPDFETQIVTYDGVTYQRLDIDGWGLWGQPGQPELPAFGKLVGMPWPGEPEISVIEIERETLTGYRLYPRPEMILEETAEGANPVELFTLDAEVYDTDTKYPGPLTAATDRGAMREQPLFRLNLYPFQYNPVRQELTVARRMRILITFPEAQLSGATVQPTSPAFRNILKQTLVNYTALPQSTPVEADPLQGNGISDEAEYIIITHPNFYNAVQELATYRTTQGLSVSVVTSQEIYDNFSEGQKNPEAIRSFLEDAYQNWSTKPVYVLLVGDSDNSAAIDGSGTNEKPYVAEYVDVKDDYLPTFYEYTSNGSYNRFGFSPIDTWYTRLTKELEEYDIYPDLIVGRIPARSAGQVEDVIDKIKNYEQSPPAGDWARRAILVADDGYDSPSEGETFRGDMDFLGSHLPSSINPFKMYDYSPSTTVREQVNLGGSILAYSGHGNDTSWSYWSTGGNMFTKSDIKSLANGNKLPFVMVANCANGFFASPTTARGFAEEFLMLDSNGSIAVFTPSASSYSSINTLVIEETTKAIFDQGDLILGSAVTAARINAYGRQTNTNFNLILFEIFTYFGDPALKLNLPAKLTLAGQASQTTVKAGSQITYQLNYGVSVAEMSRDLTLVNTLPDHVSFESATDGSGAAYPPTSINGQVLTWTLGDVPAGSGSLTIQARVNTDGVSEGDILSNQAKLYDLFGGDKAVEMEATVVVEDVPPQIAQLTSSAPDKLGSVTEFSASLVEGTGTDATYAWDFGDGSDSETSALPTVSHTYPAAGTYQATLTVSNSQGSVSETVEVVIIPPDDPEVITAPTAGFSSSSPDPLGQSTAFTNTSDDGGDDTVTYTWTFGNGETSNGKSPLYTYEAAGDYTVWLTVENSKGSDTITGTVTIIPPDKPKIFLPLIIK